MNYIRPINKISGTFQTVLFCIALILLASCRSNYKHELILQHKVDSVLKEMTLEEKIGQMAQLSSWGEENQPLNEDQSYIDEIRAGRVGSMINVNGAKQTRELQKIAVEETRTGIPLMFGYDVVHGYRTIFPIPLGLAASWDINAVTKASRIAACEATAAGQHWTFAPMVDIARDPRWGRIAESCGEDVSLTIAIANAQIKGFQGTDLSQNNTLAACAKHFVGYGAAEGGRDYNTCELSERTLLENYLPPFKAAADANVASIMMALNDLNGVPSSSSEELKKILRDDWKYESVVVSDWNSIGEMVSQGKARNAREACELAFKSSIDIDMQGNIFVNHIKTLVQDKKISEKDIDKAAGRILKLKFQLGLFENPYKYCDETRESELLFNDENKNVALEMSASSMVLLKNENDILPLLNKTQRIALIGPLADDKSNVLGSWRAMGKPSETISLLEGLKERLPEAILSYSKGCDIDSKDISGFKDAIFVASKSDIIIAAMGESSPAIGKTISGSDIRLPGVQRQLLMELKKTGKPVILVLLNGRPLALDWESENMDAILESWFPGTMTGKAITAILTGKIIPSGKLPVSFPYNPGQIPVYYNHKKFGRTPLPNSKESEKYDDAPVDALFPFGFGLSYTKFEYSDLKLNKNEFKLGDTISARITVANTGKYDGYEVVQLYVRDLYGSVTRPVKELKGFEKIFLKTGNSEEVLFKLAISDLAFYNINLAHVVEPGEFQLMAGGSSVDCLQENFIVKE